MLRTIRNLLLAWFSLSAAAVAPALVIATYNVENYLVTDRMVDGVYRDAYPKPEKEKAALAAVIAGIAPDVLAMQEMGPAPFFRELQRELRARGQDFPFAVLLDGPDPDRHLAVLSKVPFKEVRRHGRIDLPDRGRKTAVKRGVLEVVFATDSGDFSLFVVHLKSRRTERIDDPEGALQRAAEARAVRDLVLSRYPNPARARFVICGDWNDTRGSRPVRALGRRGDTRLGELVPAADSRGETWTHYFRREDTYSRIDYFLVSPALRSAVVGGRAAIWDGPGTTDASDHRAVYVRLKLD